MSNTSSREEYGERRGRRTLVSADKVAATDIPAGQALAAEQLESHFILSTTGLTLLTVPTHRFDQTSTTNTTTGSRSTFRSLIIVSSGHLSLSGRLCRSTLNFLQEVLGP